MILVTGATGLVGSHLTLHLLQNGKRVQAIYKSEASKDKCFNLFKHYNAQHLFDQIHWIPANITDVNELALAFQEVQEVYHCAAKISFDPREEQSMRKINIEGTANMVNLALDFKIKKFCFVSSIATLGDLANPGKIIDEQDNWNPEKMHSDYAITKYGAELEVWRGQEEGLNVVIVNPGIILGPGFLSEGSGQIIANVKNGLKFYTNGSSGFVGVKDVVEMMFQLMEGNHFAERYILVAENMSYLQLFNIIAQKYHLKPPTVCLGPVITSLGWKLDYVFATIFNTKRMLPKAIAKSLHTTDIYDHSKVKQTLGMSFQSIQSVVTQL